VIFVETPLAGAYAIEIEPNADERGFFARTMCREEFARYGLNAAFVQQSVSWNPRAGTLRGLHYQAAPHQEDKLVRVTRGAIFDVIVDIRRESPTYGQWFGIALSAQNHRQLYIPKGFAHGFQTTAPETEALYQMTAPFHPRASRGIRWDDPMLAIGWPHPTLDNDNSRLSYADSSHLSWADAQEAKFL
jgi:dTDP-4-dehydrorhamnose 3,5-epimerase